LYCSVALLLVICCALFATTTATAPREDPKAWFIKPPQQQQQQQNNTKVPTVNSISTLMGPPGQYLYVSGSNFVPGNTTAYLVGDNSGQESVPISPVVYDAWSIGITVPSDTETFVRVKILTPHGSGTGSQVFCVGIPINPPVVSHFTASEGSPGCYVYVGGRNFVVGNTSVKFGSVFLTPVVYSSESLAFSIPEMEPQEAHVTVQTVNGVVVSQQAFKVLPGHNSGFC